MLALKELCQDKILKNLSFFSNMNIPKDQIQELKEKDARKVISLLQDESVCKKYTLEDLHKLINNHLSVSQKIKKEFFLTLKKIEAEIIVITYIPLFRPGQRKELKIDFDQIRAYLVEQFGIAGYFHNDSGSLIIGYSRGEVRDEVIAKGYAPIIVLEKIVQQGLDADALYLINSFLSDIIKEDHQFEFKDNHLYLNLHGELITVNESTKRVSQLMHSYTPEKLIENAVNTILENLKEVKDNQLHNSIREILTQKQIPSL